MHPLPPLSHLGLMPVEQFIADYWHKQPLLIRNAFPDLEPPLSADELAGLACEDEVESRLLIEDPATAHWELKQGPFSESLFAELPASHWTLLVQAVDHWVPEAADFVEQFRFIPNWRLDDLMISYATTGGGVGPHYDNYDVFLIQAEGQRRWQIGGLYDQAAEFLPNKPVRILKHWEPEQSWVLNPGDMLYLPPRVGHDGVALSDDCVTYSVGYRAPQVGDMLMQFASFCSHALKDEDRYADPDLRMRASSGRIEAQDLERVRSIMRRFVDDPQLLRDWFGQLVTEGKCPDHPDESDAGAGEYSDEEVQDVVAALGEADLVRRSEGIRYAYHQDRDSLTLYVHSQTFACATALGPLVTRLCDSNEYAPEMLLPWFDQVEGRRLLVKLFAEGWLYTL